MASRRVGFGDEPPEGRGGWSWAVLLALGVLLAATAAVLDPTLWRSVKGWASGLEGDAAEILPWLVAIPIAAVALFVLRGLFTAIAGRPGRGAPVETTPRTTPASASRRRSKRRAGRWEEEPKEDSPAPESGEVGDKAGGWFAIIFLIFWLCGWTLGIVFAIGAVLGEMSSGAFGPHLFLLVWIAFALVGWVVAFGVLIGLLRSALSKR